MSVVWQVRAGFLVSEGTGSQTLTCKKSHHHSDTAVQALHAEVYFQGHPACSQNSQYICKVKDQVSEIE